MTGCAAFTILCAGHAEFSAEPFSTTSAAARRGGGVGVGGMTLASISESLRSSGGALVRMLSNFRHATQLEAGPLSARK
jgi:hypothetical protein